MIRNDHTDFIKNVILPYYKGNNSNHSRYIIYDLEGKIVTASNVILNMLGYSDIEQIEGKSFEQIYRFKAACPSICSKLDQMRKSVLKEKHSFDYVCIAEYQDGKAISVVQQTPVFHSSGDLIGSVEIMDDHFLNSIRANKNSPVSQLSKRQAEILFLITLGASQKEIANIFGITRGTIARSIDLICNKLQLFGSSEKVIAERAFELGYGRVPIEMLKPAVVPISKLCDNSHILKFIVGI